MTSAARGDESATKAGALTFVPFKVGFGAEVVGHDFARNREPGAIEELRRGLLVHHVLLFRGRTLEPAAQIEFTRVFGEVVHRCSPPNAVIPAFPEIFRVSNRPGQGHLNNGRYWHSDGAYLEEPTAITIHHIITPTSDGDTLYADLAMAYERLRPAEQQRLAPYRTRAQREGVSHPLVRPHPVTGRVGLYVNLEEGAMVIDGEGKERPDVVLFLREFMNRGAYRHRWRAGDLLLVDNFAAAHCATPANPRALRVLHRTTIPNQAVWWRPR